MTRGVEQRPLIQTGVTIAGRYLVEKEIGRGGMAHVYRAEDTKMNTVVALKVLPTEVSANLAAIEEIKKEARITMPLNHPNIVNLFNFESDGKYTFLVMEYIEGTNLGDMIFNDGKVFPLREVLSFLEGACPALDYAHSCNIIHKDIKPDNFIITTDNVVKLTDFGIAQKVKQAFAKITQKQVLGTLPYMSPEHIMGRKIDYRSDLYSLGVVVYEMLSGFPPFWEGSIETQIILKNPEPIEGIPDKINKIILKALSKRPDSRWGSAEQFRLALSGERLEVPTQPREKLHWPEPSTKKPRLSKQTYKILVVDDEEDIRLAVEAVLSQRGYHIEGAVDGQDALDKTAKTSYDLLICDIYMPRMNGIQLLSRLRTEGSEVPVLMLTAMNSEKYVLKSYRSGADYYMVKPFANIRLIAAARYLLGDFTREEKDSLEKLL